MDYYTNFKKLSPRYVLKVNNSYNNYETMPVEKMRTGLEEQAQHARTLRGYLNKVLGGSVREGARCFIVDSASLYVDETGLLKQGIFAEFTSIEAGRAIRMCMDDVKITARLLDKSILAIEKVAKSTFTGAPPQDLDLIYFDSFVGKNGQGLAGALMYRNVWTLNTNVHECLSCRSLIVDYDPKFHHIINPGCATEFVAAQLSRDGYTSHYEIPPQELVSLLTHGKFQVRFVPTYGVGTAIPLGVAELYKHFKETPNLEMSFEEYLTIAFENESK